MSRRRKSTLREIIPDPIFEPNYEKNIDRETSISYQVKEGDYIQIISPAGRQCSDFVAFDIRQMVNHHVPLNQVFPDKLIMVTDCQT